SGRERDHAHITPLLAQDARDDVAVTAVVALAADDDDCSGAGYLGDDPRHAGAGALHQLDPGDPALVDRPRVERPLLSGVGQLLQPARQAHQDAPLWP